MKLSIGQHLQQKQVQSLAPRMIQSMEILQLPLAALQERIEQELSENPLLEMRADDPSLPESGQNDAKETKDVDQKELVVDDAHSADDFERLLNLDREVPDHFDERPRMSINRIQENADRLHDLMANVADRGETLQEHLLHQIGELEIDEETARMCHRIVSALAPDDGGYLKTNLIDLLPPGATEEKLALAERALKIVQRLDPIGIAARDLKECLLLQLRPEMPLVEQQRMLIVNHLEDLRDNRLPQIQKATGYTIDEIHAAWDELKKLRPKPASRFAERVVPKVTPDLWVEQDENGRYVAKMDEGPSRGLFISDYYRKRLASGKATAEEKEFIKRKVNSAQWLIESIEQRRSTLLKVAQAIIDHQTAFLDNGPESIEPLKMQQIADSVGVHVTTISRAVDDKWIETPRGIFALRRFFVGGTRNDDGEDVAWAKIRIILQDLIDKEDKAKPYSDDEIVKRLKAQGLNVARRTVTKYRQKMGIIQVLAAAVTGRKENRSGQRSGFATHRQSGWRLILSNPCP